MLKESSSFMKISVEQIQSLLSLNLNLSQLGFSRWGRAGEISGLFEHPARLKGWCRNSAGDLALRWEVARVWRLGRRRYLYELLRPKRPTRY